MRRDSNQKQHLRAFPRFFRPSMRLYFAFLVVFTIGALVLQHWELGAVELLLALLLLLYTRLMQRRQEKQVMEFIGTSVPMEAGADSAILQMPLPMLIFSLKTGTILWSNESFLQITGEREHTFEIPVQDVLPDFNLNWLSEGHREAPGPARLGERVFRVYGSLFRMESNQISDGSWGILYFVDVTKYENTTAEYHASRPVVSVILLDNYDDLIKNLNESAKVSVLAQVDHRISQWSAVTKGYLCRYDRDRYIFIFEERYLKAYIDNRFALLDSVRELQSPNGVMPTVSIGVGRGAASLDESYQFAMLGIDMALSRGGDQAVIKTQQNFEFYGGHNSALERRTKVKSRVVAQALGELIADASNILVMGHKYSDLDTIGAAAAICCIARKKGKVVHVVVDRDTTVAGALIDRLRRHPEYDGVFMSPSEGLIFADSKTLLMVVDTNRPDQVESEDLLQSCHKVVVIDHHRRAADYIADAALNFHEPYASSACELATELLQYLVESTDILKTEAEAGLGGIVLDTKNFTMRTGSRTFEAAAFLRRCGADTIEVKKLMQNDLQSTVSRYSIIREAQVFRDHIAIAVSSAGNNRIIAAQAADELVNIAGIDTSFVIYPGQETVNISARSIGDVNVQVILEKLGGGGNRATAGAQCSGVSPDELCEKLKTSIDEYLNQDYGTEETN